MVTWPVTFTGSTLVNGPTAGMIADGFAPRDAAGPGTIACLAAAITGMLAIQIRWTGRPERFHGSQLLDQRMAAGHPPYPDRQRHRQRGGQALRHQGYHHPSANTNDSAAGSPVTTRSANSSIPAPIATAAIRRAMSLTCRCSGLCSADSPAVSR